MKGIVLKQDEIQQLGKSGTVTIWRAIKGQPDNAMPVKDLVHVPGTNLYSVRHDKAPGRHEVGHTFQCPVGIGEARFVRETFVLWDAMTDDHEGDLHRGKLPAPDEHSIYSWKKNVQYRASTECDDESYQWRPSTTMPEWAARYRVTCSAVAVEMRDGVWQWGISLELGQ